MNATEFDNAIWKLGDKIFYKEKEHTIEAVDFEERLIGIKSKPDLPAEDIDWVRCENCSFTPSQQPVPQYTVQGYSLQQGIDAEFIVCSAIQYMNDGQEEVWVCGLRHNDCISTWYQTTGKQTHDEEQGFLTSKNRFVNRIEAGKIALDSGQIKELKYYGGKMLDSSDLYHNIPIIS